MSSHISPGSYYKTNRPYHAFGISNISTSYANIIGDGETFMIVGCYPDNDHYVPALDEITIMILHKTNLMTMAHWWVRDYCSKIA